MNLCILCKIDSIWVKGNASKTFTQIIAFWFLKVISIIFRVCLFVLFTHQEFPFQVWIILLMQSPPNKSDSCESNSVSSNEHGLTNPMHFF